MKVDLSVRNIQAAIIICFLFLLTVCDIVMHLIPGISLGDNFAPAYASFLSNTTENHIWQRLFIWFLPIYILLICSDHYIEDSKSGYNHIAIGKMGKKKYIRSNMAESFVFPAVIVFVILLVNFLLCQIIFRGGDFWAGMDGFTDPWSLLLMAHPNFTYIIFIISTSFLAGLCGVVCSSCCLFFPDYKYAYPLAFLLWFYGVSVKYSILYFLFPFDEHAWDFKIPALIGSILITSLISVSAYVYKVHTDEL